jgi:transposase InsO family protein
MAGFYKWRRNKDDKMLRDESAVKLIRDIANKFTNKIGIRRISMKLRDSGVIMNTKKILRIKNEYNIPTKIRKRRPQVISILKNKEHRTAPNILNQNFNIDTPDKVYCTDITYLFYKGGIGYFSATKDIATKEIVAHHVSSDLGMDAGFASIATMLQARDLSGVIIHSDQGVHYTHPEYIKILREGGAVQSMSRKGVCLDNAPIESFFGHMKDELDYKYCTC